MNALNVAYEVNERRMIRKRYLVAIVYTVALAALLTGAALLMAVGPDQLRMLAAHIGLGELFIGLDAAALAGCRRAADAEHVIDLRVVELVDLQRGGFGINRPGT